MEENANTTGQTQGGNMGKEAEAQGGGQDGKEQKLFTQEEVNGLVQSRISRLKGQIGKEAGAEYEQKLSELQARESKLNIREALHERKMPRELADVITCTDEGDLNAKLDILQKTYEENAKEKEPKSGFYPLGQVRIGATQPKGLFGQYSADPVRKAMGLNERND